MDVEKIVSDGDIIRIHIKTEISPISASLSLKQFQEQFPYPSLIRINKSTIINLLKIDKFNYNHVWIKNKAISIGEKYKKDFFSNVKILKTGWK
ncbi:MAG: LytTR family transcriptional regulator DNA-binding domain-containing protein [Cyclobacteriaceae bacterium]